jgi:hypothetical protein
VRFLLSRFPYYGYAKNVPLSAYPPPSFPAEYRGFASQLRRKNAPNVSKKFEDVLKKSELSPAESNLGAPELNRQAPRAPRRQ